MTEEAPALPALLLVEDETGIQEVLATALQDEGFEVVIAPTANDAISELEEGGARFKAIITDIGLGGGPSGWDVGRRAREFAPSIPLIYMSGDSAFEWSANGVPESVMLQKPFVIAQLITALTTLLNQSVNTTWPS